MNLPAREIMGLVDKILAEMDAEAQAGKEPQSPTDSFRETCDGDWISVTQTNYSADYFKDPPVGARVIRMGSKSSKSPGLQQYAKPTPPPDELNQQMRFNDPAVDLWYKTRKQRRSYEAEEN